MSGTKVTPQVKTTSATPVLPAQKRFTLPIYVVALCALGGLVVGFALAAILGLVFIAPIGAVLGAGIGELLFRSAASKGFDTIEASIESEEVDAADYPRLFNLLESLCAVSGVAMPIISVTDDEGLNACVFLDPSDRSTGRIIFTEELIESSSLIELEGIVAVCLARLKSGILELQVETVGAIASLGKIIPHKLQQRALYSAATAQDVFDADVKACGITRYPPGLIAAFERFVGESTVTEYNDPVNSHLWLANPHGEYEVPGQYDVDTQGEGSRVESLDDIHPAIAERLALLREI